MSEQAAEPAKMSSQQLRKIKKPMIERRRRERINDSLNQLKALVLDAMNKEESRYSKMEKADILEMTVKHLKSAQRQSAMMSSNTSGPELLGKYRTGFAECAQEVGRYLGSMDGLTPEVRMRLMGHLSGCMQSAETRLPARACAISSRSGSPEIRPAMPAATQLSSLPGANIQVLTVNTSGSGSARVPSVSPVLPVSAATSPALVTAPMIVVAPSPEHQPDHLLKDAIPLYFASEVSQQQTTSPGPSSSAPPSPQYSVSSSCDSYGQSPVHRQSPELSPDPGHYYRAHFTAIPASQSPPYVREYKPTIIKTEEPSLAKRAFNTDSLPHVQCKVVSLPVWRPW